MSNLKGSIFPLGTQIFPNVKSVFKHVYLYMLGYPIVIYIQYEYLFASLEMKETLSAEVRP